MVFQGRCRFLALSGRQFAKRSAHCVREYMAHFIALHTLRGVAWRAWKPLQLHMPAIKPAR